MTEAVLHQDYFSQVEVQEIVDNLMDLCTAKNPLYTRKAKATLALKSVRTISGRLDKRELLELLYNDMIIHSDKIPFPKPVIRFVQEYLNGEHNIHRVQEVLFGLENDMKQNYFQRNIPFDDPSKIPDSVIFDPFGDVIPKIKRDIESIVSEYAPKSECVRVAKEIFEKASDNVVSEPDFNILMNGLAEVIKKKEYIHLIANIGFRDPTPQELAGAYINALYTAYERLGYSNQLSNIDRDSVLKERTKQEIYERELKIYRSSLEGIAILGSK